MPDAAGNFKGISVPPLPWLKEDEQEIPVTPEEDEAWDAVPADEPNH